MSRMNNVFFINSVFSDNILNLNIPLGLLVYIVQVNKATLSFLILLTEQAGWMDGTSNVQSLSGKLPM